MQLHRNAKLGLSGRFMKHVELHAKEAHPDLDLQPGQVEALVKISN